VLQIAYTFKVIFKPLLIKLEGIPKERNDIVNGWRACKGTSRFVVA
jgi:hypothetical protein